MIGKMTAENIDNAKISIDTSALMRRNQDTSEMNITQETYFQRHKKLNPASRCILKAGKATCR